MCGMFAKKAHPFAFQFIGCLVCLFVLNFHCLKFYNWDIFLSTLVSFTEAWRKTKPTHSLTAGDPKFLSLLHNTNYDLVSTWQKTKGKSAEFSAAGSLWSLLEYCVENTYNILNLPWYQQISWVLTLKASMKTLLVALKSNKSWWNISHPCRLP